MWRIAGRELPLDRPFVLGILNVTPDSFSDGGRFTSAAEALGRVDQMLSEGADGIDVGGESTRPQGATRVPAEEESRRVVPVIRAIREAFPRVPISVDTTKAEVAEAAIAEGVEIINDVSAFRLDARMSEIAARSGAGIILMHSRGTVEDMATYRHANYADVTSEVKSELGRSLADAVARGVAPESIVLDPGIGFAKRSEHSVQLLAHLSELLPLGRPIMVGVSRKRFVGDLTGVVKPEERVFGTVGANVAALVNGARLFRVHDVAPNRQALDVAWAVVQAGDAHREQRSDPASGDHGSHSSFPDSR